MLTNITQIMTADSPFRRESVATELTTTDVGRARFRDVIAETYPNFFFNVWRILTFTRPC